MGNQGFGIDPEVVNRVAEQIKSVKELGAQIAIVVGGGNIFRGVQNCTKLGMPQAAADYVGMLATVMNCIYVSEILRNLGMETQVFTPFACSTFTELFSKDKAVKAMEEGKIVFCGGGTGHPYFSTDTGSALRAIETGCDVLIKATKVDGVYDADPAKVPTAKKFDTISYEEVLDRKLGVMDLVAITLCRDNVMPLKVLSLNESGVLLKACLGENVGTDVVPEK